MRTNNAETAKRSRKLTNEILEDHGDWLLLDISTDKYPDATMLVDTDVWNNHDGGRVRANAATGMSYIYARYDGGKTTLFHCEVIDCEEGHEVDHIQHGTMSFVDNRISNLRSVTSSQNSMNRAIQSNNTSGIIGVVWDKAMGKWRSLIQIDKKLIHLGLYDNIDFAVAARQQAERKYFGEFAYNGGSK
jgi:hypothetical protein